MAASNISSYESRLELARNVLAPKIEKLATMKHIFFPTAATEVPETIVDSPLLRSLAAEYNVNTVSGLTVVRTKEGMGKTVASRVLLYYASRGIMFHGAMIGNTSYWRNIAICLGLPDDMSPSSTEWAQVLVETVANGYNHDAAERLSFAEKLVRGCCTASDTAPEPEEDDPLELPEGIVFNLFHARAVLIFEDVNSMTDEDLEIFVAIYRIARDIEGIFCFVTTQHADVANSLLDKSAWVKLNPLTGTFTSEVDPMFDDIPQDTGHYEHPHWDLSWSTSELRHLVTSRYDERMLQFVYVVDGMTPSALLLSCKRNEVQWKVLAQDSREVT